MKSLIHNSRNGIEAPCSPPAADSKCKEVIPFYCSSFANPVRLKRTTGNALAEAFSKIDLLTTELTRYKADATIEHEERISSAVGRFGLPLRFEQTVIT